MSSTPPDWKRRLSAVAAASKTVARDGAANARAAAAARAEAKRAARNEPPFDPTSWHGALAVMLGVAALVWVLQIVNAQGHYHLTQVLGLRPRTAAGLWGVLAGPLVHDSYGHLFANTIPFVLIGWVLLLSGVRSWLIVSGIVLTLGGAVCWLVAPSGLIVGASAFVLGWLGYLLARAYFSRSIKWIIVAVLVLFFFGTLLGTLLPSVDHRVPWQAHVSYFAAGVAAAALLHPRRRARARRPGRSAPDVS